MPPDYPSKIAICSAHVLALYYYPTRDLQRRLGLMEQGVTIFTITQMSMLHMLVCFAQYAS